MGGELVIFGVFMMLQGVFHNSHKVVSHPLIYKITHKPWLVWMFHPTVIHSAQDYGIHLVIYSGKVLSGH